jgi:hypothetical protein
MKSAESNLPLIESQYPPTFAPSKLFLAYLTNHQHFIRGFLSMKLKSLTIIHELHAFA